MSARDQKLAAITSITKHRGAALILFALFLVLITTGSFFAYFDSVQFKQDRNSRTAEALAFAKVGLIGVAITDNERPGSLPCPDSDNDGDAELLLDGECPVYIGRFPWRTLGTGDLHDGHSERLFYALSPSHRNDSAVEPLNSDSAGSITIDGIGDYVAIIFSAGMALSGQTRPSNQVIDYLEGENANGDDVYTALINQNSNDQLLGVGRTELMDKVKMRIIREVLGSSEPPSIARGLSFYYSTYAQYPDADITGDGFADEGELVGIPSYQGHSNDSLEFSSIRDMLVNNQWLSLLSYRVEEDRQQVSLAIGTTTLVASQ